MKNNKICCKPFLRWAGGKRWLLKDINSYLPFNGFEQYHEPFLGGGAIFFHLNVKKSYISDVNEELIDTYKAIQLNVEGVISHLKTFNNTKEDYYKIREQNFRIFEKKAAKFIYLNQTSFNGIYRVNLKGKYNVPYGYRGKYQFNFDNLRCVSNYLKDTTISHNDFSNILNNVKENDLVFLDPPYTVTHNNNGFVQYNKNIFSIEEQYRLSNMIEEIKNRNAYYILTNAAHPKIREIFNHGDKIIEVKRSSLVGGKNAKRGKYEELIITNGLNK